MNIKDKSKQGITKQCRYTYKDEHFSWISKTNPNRGSPNNADIHIKTSTFHEHQRQIQTGNHQTMQIYLMTALQKTILLNETFRYIYSVHTGQGCKTDFNFILTFAFNCAWLSWPEGHGVMGRMHKTICGTLATSCCRNWTYGSLAQIMQCTELSPLRFAILKVHSLRPLWSDPKSVLGVIGWQQPVYYWHWLLLSFEYNS